MLTKVKVQGKTVSEAISKGLRELNMRRDQVEITVLEQPRKGFLGIGAKPAVVEVHKKHWVSDSLDSEIYMDVPHRKRGGKRNARNSRNSRAGNNRRNFGRRAGRASGSFAKENRTPRVYTPKPNEPQLLPCEEIQNAVIPEKMQAPMQEAQTYVQNVLTHMGVKVENLHTWWDEKQQRILVTFDCDKPAIVIGKEGKTMEALQYLCTLAVTRKFDLSISVVADTQNYWRKMEEKIDADLRRAINMITNGVPVFRFRPMSAQLRRYIHRAVQGNEYVQSSSEGEGKWRKVTLHPTQKVLEKKQANMAPADFVPGVIGEDVPEQATAQAQDTQAVLTEETPTQQLATQTVAATVTQTVVETPTHEIEEHSVVVSTQPEENK